MDEQPDNQIQMIVSDLGTRIREVEERTNFVKERLLLFGKNLIETKENIEDRVKNTDKQLGQSIQEFKKISNNIKSIEEEMNNFVRKDEIILVERMLKDFQPLEFIRTKDLEEKVLEILSKKQNPKE
jgi:hypothetical protein